MTLIEKMNLIATKPEAVELAEKLMKNKTEANMVGLDTMNLSEITNLVYDRFFGSK